MRRPSVTEPFNSGVPATEEPRDSLFDFSPNYEYMAHIGLNDDSPDRWERLLAVLLYAPAACSDAGLIPGIPLLIGHDFLSASRWASPVPPDPASFRQAGGAVKHGLASAGTAKPVP